MVDMTDNLNQSAMSKHLPYEARQALVRAAQTLGTPMARVKAIDAAKARIRARFPHLFRA